MPVRIKQKHIYKGSVTPSALNTETNIIDLGDFSNDIIMEGHIDFGNLASGEKAVLKLYIAIDGTNRRQYGKVEVTGDDEDKIARIESMTLPNDAKPRVTITQLNGSLRAFPYYIVIYELEEI